MSEPYVQRGGFEYAIGNIHHEENGEIAITRGTFGKIRIGKFGEIYDKEKKEFFQGLLPDTAEVTIEFFFVHELHLLFVEQDSRMNEKQFAEKFSAIYNHKTQYGDLDIEYLTSEESVFEEIRKWDWVETVIIKRLRPSNPSTMPSFEHIEPLIKETKSHVDLKFDAIEKEND